MKKRISWLLVSVATLVAGIAVWAMWESNRSLRARAVADWRVASGEVEFLWRKADATLVVHQKSGRAWLETAEYPPTGYRIEFSEGPGIVDPTRIISVGQSSLLDRVADRAHHAAKRSPEGFPTLVALKIEGWLRRLAGSRTKGSPTAITIPLRTKGGLILINPSGILVGPSGRIDVGGLSVISTLDSGKRDFFSGSEWEFSGHGASGEKNTGAVAGGDLKFLGNRIPGPVRVPMEHGNVYALAVEQEGKVRAVELNYRGSRKPASPVGDGSTMKNPIETEEGEPLRLQDDLANPDENGSQNKN